MPEVFSNPSNLLSGCNSLVPCFPVWSLLTTSASLGELRKDMNFGLMVLAIPKLWATWKQLAPCGCVVWWVLGSAPGSTEGKSLQSQKWALCTVLDGPAVVRLLPTWHRSLRLPVNELAVGPPAC